MKPVLDPNAEITSQAVFDAVARFALRPNAERCFDGTRGCCYRSEDGSNACFVGCLMTDEEARRADTEGLGGANTVYGLRRNGLLPKRLEPHIGLLSQLQGVHDADGVSIWRDELAVIAKGRNLNTGALS